MKSLGLLTIAGAMLGLGLAFAPAQAANTPAPLQGVTGDGVVQVQHRHCRRVCHRHRGHLHCRRVCHRHRHH